MRRGKDGYKDTEKPIDKEFAMLPMLELEQKLRELDAAIAETRKRLPAHSVKPPVMMDLLDLEDQYDDVLNQIRRLKAQQAEE
jgi:hypothetical protein